MSASASATVLVVDDDEPVRQVLAELVESRGYTVCQAADGQEAWQQLLRGGASVVVSDLQMPRCDGQELCRRIRSDPSMSHVVVLIVTGCAEPQEQWQLSCDGILSKPIVVHTFLREIDRLVGRRPQG
jgi:CheY-like chemotaxis protein